MVIIKNIYKKKLSQIHERQGAIDVRTKHICGLCMGEIQSCSEARQCYPLPDTTIVKIVILSDNMT